MTTMLRVVIKYVVSMRVFFVRFEDPAHVLPDILLRSWVPYVVTLKVLKPA